MADNACVGQQGYSLASIDHAHHRTMRSGIISTHLCLELLCCDALHDPLGQCCIQSRRGAQEADQHSTQYDRAESARRQHHAGSCNSAPEDAMV